MLSRALLIAPLFCVQAAQFSSEMKLPDDVAASIHQADEVLQEIVRTLERIRPIAQPSSRTLSALASVGRSASRLSALVPPKPALSVVRREARLQNALSHANISAGCAECSGVHEPTPVAVKDVFECADKSAEEVSRFSVEIGQSAGQTCQVP